MFLFVKLMLFEVACLAALVVFSGDEQSNEADTLCCGSQIGSVDFFPVASFRKEKF